MATSVELGPGIRFAVASRSRNSSCVIHFRRRTNSSSIIARCAAGPPNAIVPSFRNTSAISPSVASRISVGSAIAHVARTLPSIPLRAGPVRELSVKRKFEGTANYEIVKLEIGKYQRFSRTDPAHAVLGRARLQPCRLEPIKTRALAPEGPGSLQLRFTLGWLQDDLPAD